MKLCSEAKVAKKITKFLFVENDVNAVMEGFSKGFSNSFYVHFQPHLFSHFGLSIDTDSFAIISSISHQENQIEFKFSEVKLICNTSFDINSFSAQRFDFSKLVALILNLFSSISFLVYLDKLDFNINDIISIHLDSFQFSLQEQIIRGSILNNNIKYGNTDFSLSPYTFNISLCQEMCFFPPLVITFNNFSIDSSRKVFELFSHIKLIQNENHICNDEQIQPLNLDHNITFEKIILSINEGRIILDKAIFNIQLMSFISIENADFIFNNCGFSLQSLIIHDSFLSMKKEVKPIHDKLFIDLSIKPINNSNDIIQINDQKATFGEISFKLDSNDDFEFAYWCFTTFPFFINSFIKNCSFFTLPSIKVEFKNNLFLSLSFLGSLNRTWEFWINDSTLTEESKTIFHNLTVQVSQDAQIDTNETILNVIISPFTLKVFHNYEFIPSFFKFLLFKNVHINISCFNFIILFEKDAIPYLECTKVNESISSLEREFLKVEIPEIATQISPISKGNFPCFLNITPTIYYWNVKTSYWDILLNPTAFHLKFIFDNHNFMIQMQEPYPSLHFNINALTFDNLFNHFYNEVFFRNQTDIPITMQILNGNKTKKIVIAPSNIVQFEANINTRMQLDAGLQTSFNLVDLSKPFLISETLVVSSLIENGKKIINVRPRIVFRNETAVDLTLHIDNLKIEIPINYDIGSPLLNTTSLIAFTEGTEKSIRKAVQTFTINDISIPSTRYVIRRKDSLYYYNLTGRKDDETGTYMFCLKSFYYFKNKLLLPVTLTITSPSFHLELECQSQEKLPLDIPWRDTTDLNGRIVIKDVGTSDEFRFTLGEQNIIINQTILLNFSIFEDVDENGNEAFQNTIVLSAPVFLVNRMPFSEPIYAIVDDTLLTLDRTKIELPVINFMGNPAIIWPNKVDVSISMIKPEMLQSHKLLTQNNENFVLLSSLIHKEINLPLNNGLFVPIIYDNNEIKPRLFIINNLNIDVNFIAFSNQSKIFITAKNNDQTPLLYCNANLIYQIEINGFKSPGTGSFTTQIESTFQLFTNSGKPDIYITFSIMKKGGITYITLTRKLFPTPLLLINSTQTEDVFVFQENGNSIKLPPFSTSSFALNSPFALQRLSFFISGKSVSISFEDDYSYTELPFLVRRSKLVIVVHPLKVHNEKLKIIQLKQLKDNPNIIHNNHVPVFDLKFARISVSIFDQNYYEVLLISLQNVNINNLQSIDHRHRNDKRKLIDFSISSMQVSVDNYEQNKEPFLLHSQSNAMIIGRINFSKAGIKQFLLSVQPITINLTPERIILLQSIWNKISKYSYQSVDYFFSKLFSNKFISMESFAITPITINFVYNHSFELHVGAFVGKDFYIEAHEFKGILKKYYKKYFNLIKSEIESSKSNNENPFNQSPFMTGFWKCSTDSFIEWDKLIPMNKAFITKENCVVECEEKSQLDEKHIPISFSVRHFSSYSKAKILNEYKAMQKLEELSIKRNDIHFMEMANLDQCVIVISKNKLIIIENISNEKLKKITQILISMINDPIVTSKKNVIISIETRFKKLNFRFQFYNNAIAEIFVLTLRSQKFALKMLT